MLASAQTFSLEGVTPRLVVAEVDVRPGLPAFTVVGMGDRAVRESRERVRAAIQNCGWSFPQQRVTVNLAPADLRKEGPSFDLAVACAVLSATGEVLPESLARTAIFGELALDGGLRPCRGAIAAAEGAVLEGIGSIIVPSAQAHEVGAVSGLTVLGARTLNEVVEILAGEGTGFTPDVPQVSGANAPPDLSDVRGHAAAVRALLIAAGGGPLVGMLGPPGAGKKVLAGRVPGLLPRLSALEELEVRRIRSVTGQRCTGLVDRPFRAPHHTISASGLIGGGNLPTPGEITLAHRGVLFLDELAEFSRPAVEALRQPLEARELTVVRAQRAVRFPAAVQLVAATNPCPCGHLGSARCRCSEAEVEQYQRRLSGPLLDRIDLRLDLERPTEEELAAAPVASSSEVRAAVEQAVEFRRSRTGVDLPNVELDAAALDRLAVTSEAADTLSLAYRRGMLSPRARGRVLRVARTIADLSQADAIRPSDVLEALALNPSTAVRQVAA